MHDNSETSCVQRIESLSGNYDPLATLGGLAAFAAQWGQIGDEEGLHRKEQCPDRHSFQTYFGSIC